FVIVQFAYLFFGGDRIEDLGLTYSEYARKGFGELQAVAIMAFFVLYSLVRFGRKSSRKLQSVMNGNLLVLLCNTLIIVVSGLVRMNVYIDVFGLSLLRLYSTVFMVFQLLLFVYLIPSLFSRNVFRQFSLISYVLFFAIVSTLALTSPERIVAKENIARSFQGLTLDHNYLMTLSSDGWMPLLMEDSVEITPIHVCHLLSESKETIEGKSWQDQTLKKTQALHYLEKLTHEYLDKNDSSATTNDLLRDECSSILMDEFDSAIEGYTSALVEKKYDKAFTEFWYPGYEPVWSEISEDISISSVSAIDSTKNPWKYVTDPFEIVEPGSTYGTSTTFELNVWDSQRGVFNCYEEDLSVELRNGKVYFNYAEVLPLGYGYKGYNGKTAVSERLDRFNNNRVSSYSECDYTYDYLY
ncbi:DUF4173 domain-containing protein, partial [Candidatus Dojkabacteria bacterium]|nr:DUF4173 domain-containing protein [Candidatus Dojkabacteria bacterium]